jgi:hypothetical protein
MRATLGRSILIVTTFVVGSCSTHIPQKPLQKAALVGTVRDPEGNPIADLPLMLVFHTGPYPSGSPKYSSTNSTGAFRFEIVEGVYELWVGSDFGYASGFPSARISGIRVAAPETRFDYTYEGFPVVGTLTGPTGLPIDSARVSVWEEHDDPPSDVLTSGFGVDVWAGPQGYKVFLPHPGRYSFFVSPLPEHTGIARRSFGTHTIAADTTLNFALDGHLVTGTVNLAGTPLDSVEVIASFTVGNDAVLTNTSGMYQMYLPAGDYDWFLIPRGPSAYVFPYRQPGPNIQGPTTVDFDLGGIRWSGVVRNSASGDPVSGVSVKAWNGDGFFGATSVSDALGQFSVIVRRPARYNLFVTPSTPGFQARTIYGILAGGDSTFDLTVAPTNP